MLRLTGGARGLAQHAGRGWLAAACERADPIASASELLASRGGDASASGGPPEQPAAQERRDRAALPALCPAEACPAGPVVLQPFSSLRGFCCSQAARLQGAQAGPPAEHSAWALYHGDWWRGHAVLDADAINLSNVALYADSVMRKRKKKMNKHKHRKRRKLLRNKS